MTVDGPIRFDHSVLQVAVVSLVSYRWSAELDPSMDLATEQRAIGDRCSMYDEFADADGVVSFAAARCETSAADRLRPVLMRADGEEWLAATKRRLLSRANAKGRSSRSLEVRLRDRFFQEHCKPFHNRPFIWHIWDGRADGFHALVNHHRLAGPDGDGKRTLESIAYA